MPGLSYVAFIDVLGFAEMVRSDFGSPGEYPFLERMKSALSAVVEQAGVQARAIQFSDSIVISEPFSPDPEVLSGFLQLCAQLQRTLFERGVLIRGGVAHGRHHHDGSFLFSQALIEAYQIENTRARYPRIVVSTETMELIEGILPGLLIDSDDAHFIDFVQGLEMDRAQTAYEECLRLSGQGTSVQEKREWLARYLHHKYPHIGVELRVMRSA